MPGKYYEELTVGSIHDHAIRRTVCEFDNVLYSSMTMNLAPAFLDVTADVNAETQRQQINPFLILSIVIGAHVPEMTAGTTHGNLGITKLEFPNPVFAGDTLHSRTTVLSKRPSRSRKDSGIVIFLHEGLNQRDEVIMRGERAALMLFRDQAAA
jgi:acyl dehydratase